jgi:AcrR family transcriptional regulator
MRPADEAPCDATRRSAKDETRRKILDAARIVFAREGFLEATLSQVAREAGLGKSSLYRHVVSKAELFVESLLDQTTDTAPIIEAIIGQHESAEQQLRALAAAQRAFLDDNPGYRQVIWAIDNQDLIGEIPRALVDRARSQWIVHLDALERVVTHGIDTGEFRKIDPTLAAHVLWNQGNLLFELRFSHERKRLLGSPIQKFGEESLELLIQGLRKRD